jgi:CDP-glycerol glycerophosphotransferase
MEKKFVSIIVPIYNVEDYLNECLESVYKVDSDNVEVILVNDGSTDNSYQIAEKFHTLYPHKTTLVNKDYGGVADARNVGLEHATGKWIAFLDSDDFINFKAFQNVLEFASNCSSDIIAFDGYRFVNDTKAILPLYSKPNPFQDKGSQVSSDYLCTMIDSEMTNVVTIWDKIYKKSKLEELQIKFIDHILHEDVEFTFNVLLSKLQIEFLPEKVIYYRQRAGSIMYTPSPEKLRSKIYLIDHLMDLYESNKIDDPILNDYVVFTAKVAILDGGDIQKATLNRMWRKKLSIKKRIILASLFILNSKIKR